MRMERNTAWAILAAKLGVLPPGADLAMVFILASDADLHGYDPEGRHVGIDYATQSLDLEIPRTTFRLLDENDDEVPFVYPVPENVRQVVDLPQLVAGSYRIELVGTSEGSFELTVNGIQDGQSLPSHTWVGDITAGEHLGTRVTVTAVVGPLTLLYEDLVVLPVEPIPTVSEWELVVLSVLLLMGIVVKFGRRGEVLVMV